MSETGVQISVVLAAADPTGLWVLTLAGGHKGQGHTFHLPATPFDAKRGQSFEDRIRDWASIHTTAQITRILQVGASAFEGAINICLLALVSDRNAFMPRGARWAPICEIFPWENWLSGEPESLAKVLRPALGEWAHSCGAKDARERQRLLTMHFANTVKTWVPEHSRERFDILYEAGLLPEALRDRTGAKISMRQRHAAVYGQIMHGNDRHALAQALSLLRTEVSRSPILPALLPAPFTLGVLQKTVEAVNGLPLHTQNFRRDLMRTGLLGKTGETGRVGTSRPGTLWTWNDAAHGLPATVGMPLPRKL